jgi:predicted CDP-diglyceride synthetase/phosphatidate cytidylyltransferase
MYPIYPGLFEVNASIEQTDEIKKKKKETNKLNCLFLSFPMHCLLLIFLFFVLFSALINVNVNVYMTMLFLITGCTLRCVDSY